VAMPKATGTANAIAIKEVTRVPVIGAKPPNVSLTMSHWALVLLCYKHKFLYELHPEML